MIAKECIFCRINGGTVPGDILYRDDAAFVIRDINPMAPVHLLIIPVRHFEYPADIDEASEALVGHLFTVASEMAQRECVADGGYRLATNQGAAAGQGVAHLHLHLLGGKTLGPEG